MKHSVVIPVILATGIVACIWLFFMLGYQATKVYPTMLWSTPEEFLK